MAMYPGIAFSGYFSGKQEEEEEKKRLEREAKYNAEQLAEEPTYDVKAYEEHVKDKPKFETFTKEGQVAYEESQRKYLSPEQFSTIMRKAEPGVYDTFDDEGLARYLASSNPAYAKYVNPDFLRRDPNAPVYGDGVEPSVDQDIKAAMHGFKSIWKGLPSALEGIGAGVGEMIEQKAVKGAELIQKTRMDYDPDKPFLEKTIPELMSDVTAWYKDEETKLSPEQYNAWEKAANRTQAISDTGIDPYTGEAPKVSDRFWHDRLREHSEGLRIKANEDIRKWITDDPELEAYMAWKADTPWNVENILKDPIDQMQRGMAEFLPSITATAIGAGAGYLMSGLNPAGAGYGAMAMGTMMEGSSSYNEAMRYMIDEKGMDPQDASILATQVASAYGLIAGWLEKFQLRKMARIAGVGEDVMKKSFTKKMLDSLISKAIKKSPEKFGKKALLASATGVMFKDSMEEGLQEMSQATMDQVTANIYRKYADNGKVDWDSAVRNFGKDLIAASTSEEAKDSFFSAMVGSLGFGIHTRGPVEAFKATPGTLKWTKEGLQKSVGMFKKDSPIDSFMKDQQSGEEETIVTPIIKDNAGYFSVLADEVSDDPKVFGERSKMLADDASDSMKQFVKSTGDLGTGEAALRLYQKAVKELKDDQSPFTILEHLDDTQRLRVESLIADQFARKINSKENLSGKLKSLLNEQNSIIDIDSKMGVKTIMALLGAKTKEDRATILRNEIKMNNKDLSSSEVEALVNSELNTMPLEPTPAEVASMQGKEGPGRKGEGPQEGGVVTEPTPGDQAKSLIKQHSTNIKEAFFEVAALVGTAPAEVMSFIKTLKPKQFMEFSEHEVFSSLKLQTDKDGNVIKNKKNILAIGAQLKTYADANIKRERATEIDLDVDDTTLKSTVEKQKTVESIEQAIAGLEETIKKGPFKPDDAESKETIDEIDRLKAEKKTILQDMKREKPKVVQKPQRERQEEFINKANVKDLKSAVKNHNSKASKEDKITNYSKMNRSQLQAALRGKMQPAPQVKDVDQVLVPEKKIEVSTAKKKNTSNVSKFTEADRKKTGLDKATWDSLSEERKETMVVGKRDEGEEAGEAVIDKEGKIIKGSKNVVNDMASELGGNRSNVSVPKDSGSEIVEIDKDEDPNIECKP